MSQQRVKQLQRIALDKIRPSPYQPRLEFNLEDLKGSILRDGILVSLTVRPKNGYFELVDGERRWRLAKELGYPTVPCDIIEIDDETARRMVWKVNTLRQDYTTKEKAHFFRKRQQEGMSVRAIGREYDYAEPAVIAYLNIFKLPEKYQQYVWDKQIGVADLIELGPLFNSGDKYLSRVTHWLDQRLAGSLRSAPELRQALRPELQELEEKRVEAARKAVPKLEPTVTKLETPEDYERAAQALRRKALQMRPPKERARIETERKRWEEERRKKEEDRKKREEEEMRRRLEAERHRIEQEARRKAREELLKDPSLIEELRERLAPSEEVLARARGAAGEAAGALRQAILEVSKEAEKMKTSEERKLVQNYILLGTVIQAVKERRIFCAEHRDEAPMLRWSCGIPVTDTQRYLKGQLKLK